MKRLIAGALVACALAGTANAESIYSPLSIQGVFTEGTVGAGFYVNENNLSTCLFGIMYINLASESGKAMLSLAITAKATGLRITRLDYAVGGNGVCVAIGLHVA